MSTAKLKLTNARNSLETPCMMIYKFKEQDYFKLFLALRFLCVCVSK